MANKIYKEKQSFNDLGIQALIALGGLGALFAAAKAVWQGSADITYVLGCLAIAAGLGGIMWYLRSLRMKVSIDQKCIKYKLHPIHVKARKIDWEDVDSCVVVRSPKLSRWQGANLSYANEHFFSLSGRNGLSLTTKDGESYLIGCKNVDRLANSLDKLKLG